jgi:hypothetical protein
VGNGVFLIQDNDNLIEMEERPYPSEDHLQKLLAKYPNLLTGDQIDSESPRHWLLIQREAALPSEENGTDRWSVDHLFLDQDAIPTLVEVKRSSDTRIRREVIGQMLDYAANAAVYWSVEDIKKKFERTCNDQKINPQERLQEFIGPEEEQETFWANAERNLQESRIRMLFVADVIPPELRRVTEFLNKQMKPAEVLAIEIKQYIGQNAKTLVSRVIGQTAEKKAATEKKQWDEASFFQSLTEKSGSEDAEVAGKILKWARDGMLKIKWGEGSVHGMFQPLIDHNGSIHHTISVWNYGKMQIEFAYSKREPPFDNEAKRQEFRERLNRIQNVSIPTDKIGGEPPIELSIFHDDAKLKQLLEILDWVIQEIKSS